ncbi:unnamed protein product (mitochondrion) [Plasmodiophora brassicae]|uniref:Uncharacterized protein n=1 Tax=Plasmodiophora brassicae TaxID=37360 RepID=A0A0G4IH95_PLABS|nr:hypothetical protein PBRA_000267 [Plasmodiophora brassicae]SPQ96827.1 unnamed protein product [Plasmodiophora brassicae]
MVNITAITLLNCVLFLKDPIAHSAAEAELPVLGPAMKFMFYHYAYLDAWGMIFKTIFALVYLAVGLFFGKYVLHDFLFRNRFEWAMFNDDKGSWFCMCLSSLWSLYAGCFIFNALEELCNPKANDYDGFNDGLGFTFGEFHEFLSPFSLSFNVFTIVMVFDDILQDRNNDANARSAGTVSIFGSFFEGDPYPNTWVGLKKIYRAGNGFVRVALFWIVAVLLITFHILVANSYHLEHDWAHKSLIPAMSEFDRSMLAAIITSLELICIMQDEEFPRFNAIHRVRLFGFNSYRIHIAFRQCDIVVTGKWFNYSLVLFTLLINFIMFDYQFTYTPDFYQQSLTSDGFIINTNGKILEKAKYLGVPRSIMGLTVLPMAVTIAGFVFCLVRDAHLKRQEKRKLKDLQALEFSVSEAL